MSNSRVPITWLSDGPPRAIAAGVRGSESPSHARDVPDMHADCRQVLREAEIGIVALQRYHQLAQTLLRIRRVACVVHGDPMAASACSLSASRLLTCPPISGLGEFVSFRDCDVA